MRANSLGGRIVGALARDPAEPSEPAVPSAARTSELPAWIEHEEMALPGRPPRLPRSSMLGRIAAALAGTGAVATAGPFTPVLQETPTDDAELTILLAGQQPARRATKPTRVSVTSRPYESVEPTSAARLGITTVPA